MENINHALRDGELNTKSLNVDTQYGTELKQFVKEALVSIVEGVEEANSEHKRFKIIGVKSDESGIDGNNIEFDVSVGIEQKISSQIEGEVDVGTSVLKVISANVDSKLDQSDSKQNINRLKFTIWVSELETK